MEVVTELKKSPIDSYFVNLWGIIILLPIMIRLRQELSSDALRNRRPCLWLGRVGEEGGGCLCRHIR